MTEVLNPKKELEDLQDDLREVQKLLRRQRIVEGLLERQDMPRHDLVESLVHKQGATELRAKLDRMHSADVAYILESLPLEERLVVWDLVKAERDGEILLEVSDAVRESLIKSMDTEELVAAAEQLDTDELADLAPDLPDDVIQDVFQSLPVEEREQLRAAMSYPEDSVGAIMDFDVVSVRADITLETVTRYLRRFDELPDHTDQLFVVDRHEQLRGVLPLNRLIVSELDVTVDSVMKSDTITLYPDDKAKDAAQAFERYDLVSTAVVDEAGKLVGRVTIDKVVDYIRDKSESEALAQAGLREEEDIFASVWDSVKNRWAWLAVNLITAFVASRVIGAFEGSIEKLVALAALMPIVAGVGGNAGTQTLAVTVRAIATNQLTDSNTRRAIKREMAIAFMNGATIAALAGIGVTLWFQNFHLGFVIAAAMQCNILLAGFAGVFIPVMLDRFDQDPAVASSVFVTMITDSMGFLIFLSLAVFSGLVG